VLALVDAAAVGQAKAQLLQAVADVQTRTAQYERAQKLADAIPRVAFEAEAALREAEIKLTSAEQGLVNLGFTLPENLAQREGKKLGEDLRHLGIPTDLLPALEGRPQTSNLIPLVSPVGGVLVAAHIVNGEAADPSTAAMVVADPGRMWLNLSVRQEDASYLSPGLRVVFDTDDSRVRAEGTIDWISPAIDERTRTLNVRVHLANESGKLRDKTFGIGRIVLREEPQAILVPREAVQSAGDVQLVFVRSKDYFLQGAPKLFYARQVRIGGRTESKVELLASVLPGEVVATKGSNVLLAQLLRANLGAGCGCHDGHTH
jgi:cobalt-zinc-cadmium efflux system membrane fusion protein